MSTTAARFTLARLRCHWRPMILAGAAIALLGVNSITPSFYLWCEISKPLAAIQFVSGMVLGWMLGLVF